MDSTFNQPVFDSDIFDPAIRPLGLTFWIEPPTNGRFAIGGGGNLKEVNGVSVPGIVALNADGTLDDTFNIGEAFAGEGGEFPASFADPLRGGEILDVSPSVILPDLAGFTDAVELPDGSLLIGGQFFFYNDHYSPGLVRLFADGSIDFDLWRRGILQ